MNQEKKQSIAVIFRNNIKMLAYIYKYTPSLIIFTFAYMVISGVRGVLNNVYSIKFILDSIQLNRKISTIIVFLLIFIFWNLLDALFNALYENYIVPKKEVVLYQKMHTELFQKAKSIELACYDNPKFYNDFVWASSEADEKAMAVLKNAGDFVQRLTRIVGVGAIFLNSDVFGIIIVAVSLGVSFLTQLKVNKLDYELALQQKPLQRERDYTSRVLYMSDYAKEIRLSHVHRLLIKNFSQVNKRLIKVIQKFGRKLLAWDFISYSISNTWLLDGVYTAYLAYLVIVKNAFTYGTFLGLYNGVFNLRGDLNRLGKIFANFQNDSLYIQRFMEFIQYEPKIKEPDKAKSMPESAAALELKDVSFCYQGNEEATLHHINLKIHPGEKVALVGYNGAGKSTLIKLLLRLYDATEGEILLNGQNIKNYKTKEYRSYFGVVFQDFQLFAASIAENVVMDQVKKIDSNLKQNGVSNENAGSYVDAEQEKKIYSSLELSGFEERLDELPKGIDTMLTREFSDDGVNLSGGEAQKVAIARTFWQDCKMVILDEPSSALDPISEYNVNQSMLRAAEDKTVFFISHRLSTTRIADRILMLENGRIIEQGSHDELMKQNGKYAQMFLLQAEKYKNQKKEKIAN